MTAQESLRATDDASERATVDDAPEHVAADTPGGATVDGPGAQAGDGKWRLRHLPFLLGVSGVFVVLAAVVGAVLDGGTGAAGAAVGVAIVTLGYAASTLMIAWADSIESRLVLAFGLAAYVTKLSLLGALLTLVAATGWAGLVPLCLGVAAGVVVWTGAHIWWLATVHARRVRHAEMSN